VGMTRRPDKRDVAQERLQVAMRWLDSEVFLESGTSKVETGVRYSRVSERTLRLL